MTKKLSLQIRLIGLLSLHCLCAFSQTNWTRFVNPMIGTGGHGHTYPGATLPHGMVQLSPDTRLEGWDGCGGYHYSDNYIYGFSHTHLSGTGCSDYGDILLMPGSGIPSPDNKIYGSPFTHVTEIAKPGYYSVNLTKPDIDVELTTTERVGYHHYIFNSPKNSFIIIDLKHRDQVIESSIKIEDSITISGMRRSKAWAKNQYVYFVMKLSQPIKNWGIWRNNIEDDTLTNEANGNDIKAYIYFKRVEARDVYVKVAISNVSFEGAKKNMEAETAGKSFSEVRDEAKKKWNDELSKITISSTDTNKLNIFYTALYHTAIVPNINMDVDGHYRGMDNQIHQAIGFDYYSVFSLWDTYRAAHPLYTIIDKKRTLDYIKTFLVQYEQGGRLPVWELASNETDCMIGYHSVPVIVDAFQKGITNFNTELALNAMLKSANWPHLGLPAYTANGVIAVEDEHESVSKQLEYAYDDYCIALFAKSIGDQKTYESFIKRAQYYKNIFDPTTGFMRPRKNGGWLQPFEPREVNNHFTEANSWQYSFYFPQDINGFIQMIGGKDMLEKKLDELFSASSQTTGRDQSDITGLIGQYAHGNEPSHHIAYLYNYTRHPYKAQFYTHKIMQEFYKNNPDGLIGNEDCGQMSAWYVMSALGFYPITPGNNSYMIGAPQFSKAEIHLENGKSFIIDAAGANNQKFYIQSATKTTSNSNRFIKWKYPFLNHADIANGGAIHFKMGEKPRNCFNMPITDSTLADLGKQILVLNPIINGGQISFTQQKTISISSVQANVQLMYRFNNKNSKGDWIPYSSPFTINESTEIAAIAVDQLGNKSFETSASYKKNNKDWQIHLNTTFEPQYEAGGAEGLIDGVNGTTNWRMGNWQGYQLQNVDAMIDLKTKKNIGLVTVGFLQDVGAWIVMPKNVTVYVSEDSIDFKKVFSAEDIVAIADLKPQVKKLAAAFSPQSVRYIRIVATQYGKLPSWHEGAGGDTHIFVDEVDVE